jgi:hypothetical protein
MASLVHRFPNLCKCCTCGTGYHLTKYKLPTSAASFTSYAKLVAKPIYLHTNTANQPSLASKARMVETIDMIEVGIL